MRERTRLSLDRGQCSFIISMKMDDHLPWAIHRETGFDYRAVKRVWLDPEFYDPIDDPIAVERAMQCDVAVIDRLTHFEWETFTTLMRERKPWERDDARFNFNWLKLDKSLRDAICG